MKKPVSLLLVLVLLCSFIPSAFALTYTYSVGDSVWEVIWDGEDFNNSSNNNDILDYYITSGSVPPGLNLTQSYCCLTMSGTPTTVGNYNARIHVSTQKGELDIDVYANVTGGSGAAVITKQPTSETVVEGGSAMFVVKADNMQSAYCELLHKTTGASVAAQDISSVFGCGASFNYGGGQAALTLTNVTKDLNYYDIAFGIQGSDGSYVHANNVSINVTEGPMAPEITKHPTGEEVEVGQAAIFIAAAENVKSMSWRIVSPDKTQTYDMNAAMNYFAGLGMYEEVDDDGRYVLTLTNIPEKLNGYKVEAKFTGTDGSSVFTNGALVTVTRGDVPIPAIMTQPKAAEATMGESVVLSVAVSAERGQMNYEWYYSPDANMANIKSAGMNSLSFTVPQTEGTVYYCVGVYAYDGARKSPVVYSDLVPVTYKPVAVTPSPEPTASFELPELTPEPTLTPTNTPKSTINLSKILIAVMILLVIGILVCVALLVKEKIKPSAPQVEFCCYNCGWSPKKGGRIPNFCPECGAVMIKKELDKEE